MTEPKMSESQKWMGVVMAVAGGWLLWLLAPVLTPFLVAALLAYLGDPWVDRLEARRLPRTAAVVVVFLVIFGALGLAMVLLVPMLEHQIGIFVAKVPGYLAWVQEDVLPRLEERLGPLPMIDLDALKETLRENWRTAGGLLGQVAGDIWGSGMRLLAWIGNLILIPVVVFYLLRDWDLLVEEIRSLLPRDWEPVVSGLTRESDDVLGAFLRGQLMVMVALGAVYSTGLYFAGLELALLVGLLAGAVSFVPYLGVIVGVVVASLAMYLQTQELVSLLPVLGVFGLGQVLEGMVLTPLLVGDRIGLHPVAVIFAVLAGGQLFGFVGVLLALPVAAVVAVVVRHAHERYLQSGLYAGRGRPADEEGG